MRRCLFTECPDRKTDGDGIVENLPFFQSPESGDSNESADPGTNWTDVARTEITRKNSSLIFFSAFIAAETSVLFFVITKYGHYW